MRYKTIIMGYILVPIDKKQPLAEIAFNGTATGGGTVSGTGASPTVDLTAVTGYGSGGQVAVTKGGDATIATATITVKTAGDGYAIGDVVSFAAITTGAATKTTATTSYTIVDGDLVGDTGDQTIPVESVLFAMPNDDNEVDLITRNWNTGTSTVANASVTKYTIQVTGGSAISDQGDLANDADGALVKSSQGHLVPAIVWNSAVEGSGNSGLSVTYVD
jgi:hypothetical protein|tara:strand:+ start:844 stop:1500 length:657 start_codon:yes stop_codon:yes gene_type:complete